MCPSGNAAMVVESLGKSGSELCLDLPQLQRLRTPIQETVGNLSAASLGLGDDPKDNLKMRKKLGKPGAPFGGLGLFDPQKASCEETETKEHPELTARMIKQTKLKEFWKCSQGLSSVYFWALQPIFNTRDHAMAAEILVRAKNGSDCAPFEDLQAIMDPAAPNLIKQVYAEWKAAEIVDFPLRALRENPMLQRLAFISSNLRPLDVDPESSVFRLVAQKLEALCFEDRELVLSMVVVEITEDQEHPESFASHIEAWVQLGFRVAFDDIVGEIAAEALGHPGENFNTSGALDTYVQSTWLMKVDMDWAGRLLFLAHPSMDTRPDMRKEVLQHARDDDEIFVPAGPALRKVGVKHSAVLQEFAEWALEMITHGKQICIELTVRPEDDNCALAIEKLRELGLDMFGEHKASFWFQGGPCGAKAFLPGQLAASATVFEE